MPKNYQFSEVIGLVNMTLLEIFKCQLNRKRLIVSNREGVTRLAPKVDGVPTVEELRPITLLNCDYKILAKWLV